MRTIDEAVSKARVAASISGLDLASSAHAQQEVGVGVIFPLTRRFCLRSDGYYLGALNSPPTSSTTAPRAAPTCLLRRRGLAQPEGAKIKLVFADHQGNPQVGATEAERLITQEKVVAILGAYDAP